MYALSVLLLAICWKIMPPKSENFLLNMIRMLMISRRDIEYWPCVSKGSSDLWLMNILSDTCFSILGQYYWTMVKFYCIYQMLILFFFLGDKGPLNLWSPFGRPNFSFILRKALRLETLPLSHMVCTELLFVRRVYQKSAMVPRHWDYRVLWYMPHLWWCKSNISYTRFDILTERHGHRV